MELCYVPSILLFVLGIVIAVKISRAGLYWTAAPVFASPALFFAIVSFALCKKGYKKIAWFLPLGALILTSALFAGV